MVAIYSVLHPAYSMILLWLLSSQKSQLLKGRLFKMEAMFLVLLWQGDNFRA